MPRLGGPLIFAASLASVAESCYIQGVDSGVCKKPEEIAADMPFCGTVVRYPACVPKEFAWFPNHTLAAKDAWARRAYSDAVQRRMEIEAGYFPANLQLWEGDAAAVERFTNNEACQNAYKNYLCYMNFPRCDDTGNSLILCRSVCENFFKACQYRKSMWRCYNPEYYGGEEAEPDTLTDSLGLPIYLRAMFPGQPFRTPLFHKATGEQLVVCTPSLEGGAMGVGLSSIGVVAVLVAVVAGSGLDPADGRSIVNPSSLLEGFTACNVPLPHEFSPRPSATLLKAAIAPPAGPASNVMI